ncbi:hypothetical protein BJ878DRAFT_48254 [Calycina marina]|uniref:Uncharacterized protein n=1 Tax=Calycina marina TaxID=1763456 RepID=A0A9P7Z3V5_9HELO|nr:hypothetical protein BJ878DRAFT_48254 [Calycina marina]
MAPIPVYSGAPINAAKAEGVTPKTAEVAHEKPGPPTTTTGTTSDNGSYPQAQPGAPAMPAPTDTATQRYAHVQPTPTTDLSSEYPAPPQPGAAPVAPRSHIAPPPRAGETYQPPQQNQAQEYPPQMSYSPSIASYGVPPHSSTSTSTNTAFSPSYPVHLPSAEQGGVGKSLDHPPGYVQNAYASEMSSDQRRAQEAAQNSSAGDTVGEATEGIWNTAKAWANTAGAKISEAETEVWRRIGKE